MEDNNVYIKLKINTDGFKMGTKEVANHVSNLTSTMNKYSKTAQASITSAANAFIKQNKAVADATREVEKLTQDLADAKNQKTESDTFIQQKEGLQEVQKEILKYSNQRERLREIEESNGKLTKSQSAKYEELRLKLKDLTAEERDYIRAMSEMKKDGTAFTSVDTSDLERKLEDARNKQSEATNRASSAYQRFNGALEKSNKSLKENVKETKKAKTNHLDLNRSFKKGLTTILKYAFGIRSLYVAWRKLRSAMVEGFSTLAKEDKDLNKALSGVKTQLATFKNSFASAFSPLVKSIAPMIEAVVKKLNYLMQRLSMFIAILSGSKTYKVAAENWTDYAESLDKTAESAKKAKKYLSGLDEINTFDPNETSGAGQTTSFIDKQIDGDKTLPLLDNIKKKFEELKNLFKSGFFDGLGDFATRLADIERNAGRIKTALMNIFTDGEVMRSANNLLTSITTAFGQIAGSFASIGLTIAQNLVGGIAQYLTENEGLIKNKLTSIFDINAEIWQLRGKFAEAVAFIFEAFGGENGQTLTANIIGIFADAFLNITELASKVERDLEAFLFTPIINNSEGIKTAVDGALGFLAGIAGTAKTAVDDLGASFNSLYDESIKPFADEVTTDFSTLVGKIVDWWNTDIQPIIDDIEQDIEEMYKEYIKPITDDIIDIVKNLIAIMREYYDFLKPIIDTIAKVVLPALAFAFQATWTQIKAKLEWFFGLFKAKFDLMSGIIKAFIQLLNGDFAGAWQTLKATLKQVFDDIVQAFKDRWINNKIDIINEFFDKIRKIKIDVPDDVPLVGGLKLDLSDLPHIPRLATGAVIPPNAPFMAMLGDQKNGTNLELPENLLRQVVREEGGNGSYQFIAQINRRVLFDEMISEAKLRQSANGRNPFEFA